LINHKNRIIILLLSLSLLPPGYRPLMLVQIIPRLSFKSSFGSFPLPCCASRVGLRKEQHLRWGCSLLFSLRQRQKEAGQKEAGQKGGLRSKEQAKKAGAAPLLFCPAKLGKKEPSSPFLPYQGAGRNTLLPFPFPTYYVTAKQPYFFHYAKGKKASEARDTELLRCTYSFKKLS
jgi:hypothetical protein